MYLLIIHHLPTHRLVELLESLTGAKPSAGFVHTMLARTASTGPSSQPTAGSSRAV